MTEILNELNDHHIEPRKVGSFHASYTTWQASSQTPSCLYCAMGGLTSRGRNGDYKGIHSIANARYYLQVYISGNGLMILGSPSDLIQTIYHEDRDALLAVTIDELTGKIATSTSTEVYVYRPYGKDEGLLKVSTTNLSAVD